MAEPPHLHHARAQAWFHSEPGRAWATCPLTENAFVRILGNPNYVGVPGDPAAVRLLPQKICSFPGHQFWPDSLTLVDTAIFPDLPGSQKLTDVYLLALAVSQNGNLAT
ncbi:MAG: putative nucleic acid-binding protein [Verrucomicrobiales bacterium]|jgi:predicted nucleic acid-binding protein